MTAHRRLEFTDDTAAAVVAIDGIAAGLGWCNLTPEIDASDVDVLSPSVFSLRVPHGSPVATLVTSPDRKGVSRPSTLGVLHTRGRLGAARVADLLGGADFAIRQDHNHRGLLLEVPPATRSIDVLGAMTTLLTELCDFHRTGTWRLDVYERHAS